MRLALKLTILLLAVSFVLLLGAWLILGLVRGVNVSPQQIAGTAIGLPTGLYSVILIALRLFPNPIKVLTASILRLIPFLTNYWKRRAVKDELEGNLNAALREFSEEGAGFINHEVKVEWLTPDTDARESFFRSDTAFLRLNFSENNDRNLVEAALMFCSEGLLHYTRQYVRPALMRAIDLVFVDEVLERRQAAGSRTYLIHHVLPREIKRMPETSEYMSRLGLISQYGFFTRILLSELRDYTGYVPSIRMELERHYIHVERFLGFLHNVISSREDHTETSLTHVGGIVNTAIVLVGKHGKPRSEGTSPYIEAAAIHNSDGARTVYLWGYEDGVNFVRDIARDAKEQGLVRTFDIDDYSGVVGDSASKFRIARMTMNAGAVGEFLKREREARRRTSSASLAE